MIADALIDSVLLVRRILAVVLRVLRPVVWHRRRVRRSRRWKLAGRSCHWYLPHGMDDGHLPVLVRIRRTLYNDNE